MDIVALVTIAGTVEDEAPKLAVNLGVTPYEAGLTLRLPLPQVVLRTEDRARALDLLGKLRARGHEALACDLAAVVSSEAMFKPRSFRFDEATFFGTAGPTELPLKLDDVFAVVRATHTTTSEEKVVHRERKVSIGRAALTGGLLTTKTTEKESTRVSTDREPVIYLFSHASAPWLLSATNLRYEGLGERRSFSTVENFDVLARILCGRTSGAVYDTRLVQARPTNAIVSTSSRQTTSTSSSAIDTLAHIVAMSIHRAAQPYR